MTKAYWIVAVLVLAIIGGGTALYLQKKNAAPSASVNTVSVPTAESGRSETKAAATAGLEATDTTLVDLSNDIDSITEDTDSTNTEDETPNL